MIGSLRGSVTAHLGQRILVEVQGIGYWVHTGSWQPDGDITCYLHQYVREDIAALYGFPDLQSLGLFELLLGISGVGPKAALAILSLGTPERIRQAISQQDAGFLSQAPGIGSKAAQKIILELQQKVGLVVSGEQASPSHLDIRTALEGLGYKPADIQPWLDQVPAELASLNDQLKWVLQQIGKSR